MQAHILQNAPNMPSNLAALPSVHQIDWHNWQPNVLAVLCYISNPQTDEVLLIKRLSDYAHGLISAPWWESLKVMKTLSNA